MFSTAPNVLLSFLTTALKLNLFTLTTKVQMEFYYLSSLQNVYTIPFINTTLYDFYTGPKKKKSTETK